MQGNCCGLDYDEHFNADEARRDILDYRAHGAQGSTRRLLDVLIGEGVKSATLLDIGGGVGILQLELLHAGIDSSLDVDASSPYIAVARAEAEEHGFGGRTEYRHGDFVDLADEIGAADLVTLDRVICCYADVASLVRRSAEHARRLYGLVYPVDRWWTRAVGRLMNLVTRLSGSDYRMHIHSAADVDRLIREAGLEPRYHHAGMVWQTAVYARVGRQPALSPVAEAAGSAS
jgi:hypothetical protein